MHIEIIGIQKTLQADDHPACAFRNLHTEMMVLTVPKGCESGIVPIGHFPGLAGDQDRLERRLAVAGQGVADHRGHQAQVIGLNACSFRM